MKQNKNSFLIFFQYFISSNLFFTFLLTFTLDTQPSLQLIINFSKAFPAIPFTLISRIRKTIKIFTNSVITFIYCELITCLTLEMPTNFII